MRRICFHRAMKTSTQFENPKAHAAAQVTCGDARFTVLTPRMIRMEYAADGRFEDRATLAVANRRLSTPPFKVTRHANGITLRTSTLSLEYQNQPQGFTADSLRIRFKHKGAWTTWHYGQQDKRNLGGTARTLDEADGAEFVKWKPDAKGNWRIVKRRPVTFDLGLLSRSGWALIDDSNGIPLDPSVSAFTPWAQPRPAGPRHDLYFLGYGSDFKGALRDGAAVFGAQPLPPRYALGYWYSRYWAYTDREIESLVNEFDRLQLPLDVMVIDMDWHLPGWTGYTWDPDYFPDPSATLKTLRKRDVKITLNLHPADGVGRHESAFPQMCRALGIDPRQTERIPFDSTDPAFMDAYFRHLHHPEEARGVNFWWMDWQQGTDSAIPGLDPLPWLNHLHWVDQRRKHPRQRPLNFSRYGGIGSGRYPVGFSGDTHSTWASLAYQPYFTATAANVLYGTWSHDIGGHAPGPVDPELYTRWLQFGVYSPILRTHTTKRHTAERRVWLFPEPYREAMMDQLHARYRLIPYLYTEMRATLDTALTAVRPLYHEYPDRDEAYRFKGQYFFGSSMLVAPVCRPLDPRTEMATQKIWLPPGTWYDAAWGRLEKGDRVITRRYLLDEVPVFIRAGAILPGQRDARRTTAGSYSHLTVEAYPGGNGSYTLYEDDGISQGYLRGQQALIPLTQTVRGRQHTVTLGPVDGRFKGFKAQRPVTVCWHGHAPPASVQVNGQAVDWSYDGDRAQVVVELARVDLRQKTCLTLQAAKRAPRCFSDGWSGLLRRLNRVAAYTNQALPVHPLHADERLAVRLAQTGNRIARQPATAAREVRALNRGLRELPDMLREYERINRKTKRPDPVTLLKKARAVLTQTLKDRTTKQD